MHLMKVTLLAAGRSDALTVDRFADRLLDAARDLTDRAFTVAREEQPGPALGLEDWDDRATQALEDAYLQEPAARLSALRLIDRAYTLAPRSTPANLRRAILAARPLLAADLPTDAATVRAVVALLDAREWTPDTVADIADVLRAAGHDLRDLDAAPPAAAGRRR